MGANSSSAANGVKEMDLPSKLRKFISHTSLIPLAVGGAQGTAVFAQTLHQERGAIYMLIRREEGQMISSLLPKLQAAGKNPRLIGVLHETGRQDGFRPFFTGGELYFDEKKNFFKFWHHKLRYLGLISGFTDKKVWSNVKRAEGKGIEGDLKGEGRLLGGVIIVGPGDQGVVYEHQEKVWGDHCDPDDVFDAVMQMGADGADADAGAGAGADAASSDGKEKKEKEVAAANNDKQEL